MLSFVASAYALSAWTQIGQDIDGEASADYSGKSVAMSSDGSIVAIGATHNDAPDSPTNDNRGHVRVYRYNGKTWTQMGQDIDGEVSSDQSGKSIAMSSNGTRLAVGAPYNTNSKGHVFVWGFNGTNWTRVGGDIDGEANGDLSGWSLAMSDDGTKVAIGAYLNNGDSTSSDSGHVRVYGYSDTSTPAWTQMGEFDGEDGGDWSGYSVAMSSDGKMVAIGAIQNDGETGNSGDNRGHVRVYRYSDTSTPAWTQMGKDIDGEASGDQSGYSVAMSSDGTKVAIGATYNDGETGNSGDNRGHVRVYSYDGTGWSQVGLDIDGEDNGDWSGYSVAMSSDGTKVAIGAIYNNGGSTTTDNGGHVRVWGFQATKDDDDDAGLSTGAIVGIAVGATAGAVAIGAAGYYAIPLVFTGGKYKPVDQPFI